MTFESAYYNEKVTMWEPFIEPVESPDEDTHLPWHAVVEVYIFTFQEKYAAHTLSDICTRESCNMAKY